MKKQISLSFVYTVLSIYFICSIFCNTPSTAQVSHLLSKPISVSDNATLNILQWQIDHSLLTEVCEASAGVLTVNVENECLLGKELIASTNDTHQMEEGYTLHYILWDISNPNFPRFKAINTTGVFEAPTETKTYQIYAYSEQTADAPTPSPTAQANTPIAAIGAEYVGCSQVISTQAFTILGTFRLKDATNAANSNIHIYEICGGKLPYKYEFSSSEGFANIEEFPGTESGCRRVRLQYGTGANWNFTARDASECEHVLSYSSAESLFPIIMGFDSTPETCPNDVNGALTVMVQGGVKCELPALPYSYMWEGPNGYTGEGATITDLAAGNYTVVVTDCMGSTTSEEVKVRRHNGSEGRGSSRRSCRGDVGKADLENTAIEWIEVYPNPIVQQAFVEFILDETTAIEGRILNFNGQEVAHFYRGNAEVGVLQRIPFSVENLPSGMYMLQLQGDSGWQYLEKIQVVR
ncbi:MAG: T9SS type A sorting domain-containing protein [Chitinophagales bacterium]